MSRAFPSSDVLIVKMVPCWIIDTWTYKQDFNVGDGPGGAELGSFGGV